MLSSNRTCRMTEPEGEYSLAVVDINGFAVSHETRVLAGGLHKTWIEAMIVIDGRESCAGGEFARFSAGNALPDTLTQIIYIHFFSNGNVRDFF